MAITDEDWDTFWIADNGMNKATLKVKLHEMTSFDHIALQEYITFGQRIAEFEVLVKVETRWKAVAEGTTIGHKRILQIDPAATDQLRIQIKNLYGRPLLKN